MLYFQRLLYMSKIIQTELINWYHINLLATHFRIEETWKLVAQKYYWLILQADIKAYIKRYNICLALKTVKHKLYKDISLFSILICW